MIPPRTRVGGPLRSSFWSGVGGSRSPAAARAPVGDHSSLRASTRGEVVVLRCDGPGRPVAVDERGRLIVPRWLRDATGGDGSLLVGSRTGHDAEPVVLLAPTRLLAGAAEALVGEGR